MNSHDLFLLTSGGLIGAYLLLLALVLGGVWDDARSTHAARLTPIPVRAKD